MSSSPSPHSQLVSAVTLCAALLVVALLRHRSPVQRQSAPTRVAFGRTNHAAPRLTNSHRLGPCNVVSGVPFYNWSSPHRESSKGWTCQFIGALPSVHVTFSRWFPHVKQPSAAHQLRETNTAWFPPQRIICFPNKNASQCAKQVSVPSNKWIRRAGIGNRFFVFGAAVVQAVELGLPLAVETPLGWAGGPLPAGSLTKSQVQCSTTMDNWTPRVPHGGPFHQDQHTANGLLKHRSSICELLAQPDAFADTKQLLPASTDIVIYLRELSLASTSYFESVISHAKRFHGGVSIVLVSKPCVAQHPMYRLLIDKYNASPHNCTGEVCYEPSPLPDLQFLSHAKILVVGSASTFGWWGAYLASDASVAYFPILHSFVYFNPWCEMLVNRNSYIYVDASGTLLSDFNAVNAACKQYDSTHDIDKKNTSIAKMYAAIWRSGC